MIYLLIYFHIQGKVSWKLLSLRYNKYTAEPITDVWSMSLVEYLGTHNERSLLPLYLRLLLLSACLLHVERGDWESIMALHAHYWNIFTYDAQLQHICSPTDRISIEHVSISDASINPWVDNSKSGKYNHWVAHTKNKVMLWAQANFITLAPLLFYAR